MFPWLPKDKPHPRIIINNSPAALVNLSSGCLSYCYYYYYYYYYYYSAVCSSAAAAGLQKALFRTKLREKLKKFGKNTFMRFPLRALVCIAS